MVYLTWGVDVEVFGNGARKMRGVKTHSLYKEEQFEYIQRPYYDVIPILHAHMSFALNRIIEDGKFDIIHDHNTFLALLSLVMRPMTSVYLQCYTPSMVHLQVMKKHCVAVCPTIGLNSNNSGTWVGCIW